MAWVVVFCVVVPELLAAYAKVFAEGCLVPENTVLNFVARLGIVQYKALVILCAVVEHSAEHVKGWKNTEETPVEVFSVLPDVFAEDKDIVHVGSDHRGHVHDVLTAHGEKQLPVASIHKALSDALVAHKGSVVHTVIHEQKGGLGAANGCEFLLALQDFLNSPFVIVAIDEEIGYKGSVVVVAILCARHDYACWYVSLVVQNVCDER